jgi:hypothetical protein
MGRPREREDKMTLKTGTYQWQPPSMYPPPHMTCILLLNREDEMILKTGTYRCQPGT